MIGVGVGDEDPLDPARPGRGHRVEMLLVVVGPRVDDGDVVGADEVGVGTGAGHHAGIVGQHPPHQGAENHDLAGGHHHCFVPNRAVLTGAVLMSRR